MIRPGRRPTRNCPPLFGSAEAARRALQEKLKEERLHFDSTRDELRLLTREYREQTLPQLLESLTPTRRALQARLATAFQRNFGESRASLPALSRAVADWLRATFAQELTQLSHSRRAMFIAPLQQARQSFARLVEAFQNRLAQRVQAALGIQLAPRRFESELPEPGAPPVDIGPLWDTPLEIVGYLVPMFLFRRLVIRHLEKRLHWEAEKNLSRLAAQWSDRVVGAIDATAREAEQYAEAELATLEKMLSQTESGESELHSPTLLTTSLCPRLAINDLITRVELEGETLVQHLLQLLASALDARLGAGKGNAESFGQFLLRESFKLCNTSASRYVSGRL